MRPLVRVGIFDLNGSLVNRATAGLAASGEGQPTWPLRFDASMAGHVSGEIPPGSYLLAVSADGLETQRRRVQVAEHGLEETVVLGPPGLPHYYRGHVRVPFEPVPFVGLSLSGPSKAAALTAAAVAEWCQTEIRPLGESVDGGLVHLLRVDGEPVRERQNQLVKDLNGQAGVRHAGPVVSLRRNAAAFFTHEFVLRFNPSVTSEEMADLLTRHDFVIQRSIPYLDRAYLVRSGEVWTGLDACAALMASGQIEFAEPNLVATATDDQVKPSDSLFSRQWHLRVTNLPRAWAFLRSLNHAATAVGDKGDLTFGSENITLSVFDQGIPSRTEGDKVFSIHPDFDGTVTGGAAKVAAFFDFTTMSPNNDKPHNGHGIRCAGVAAALANNPSPIGEHEGVVGAAPNCRVMAVIRDAGGTELDYADAFIWMAGFDPRSPRRGFPPPLSFGVGADVISCSFGLDATMGAPISGLMSGCFDFLTEHGRGGRGVVLCLSAGNIPEDFRLLRPWAAYDKTIAVTASSPADSRPIFGGFGPGIDLCAPGGTGTGSEDIVTCDVPGSGTLAGHRGGTADYTELFSGTSASTPLVAGVAALVLSANPNLSWREVRDVLCSTAARIDLANDDPIGHWVDTDGDGRLDHSQWYGFGRIDAHAAVVEAVRRNHRR